METLYDVYQFFCQHSGATTIGSFLIAIAIEKSKTIKFNPFSFIGDLLTGRVMDRVEESQQALKDDLRLEIRTVDEKLTEQLKQARRDSIDRYDQSCEKYEELKKEMAFEMQSNYMKQKRIDMFRFEEGILRGVTYTKEHWHNMRNTVLEYEKFCKENDRFINSECENAMKTILETWETHPWENNNE